MCHGAVRLLQAAAPARTSPSMNSARPSAQANPVCSTSSAPTAAPTNMVSTASARLVVVSPELRPESAAMPVSVMVSTVVVRSGTASRRAVVFWMPIAVANSAATTTALPWPGRPLEGNTTAKAATTSRN